MTAGNSAALRACWKRTSYGYHSAPRLRLCASAPLLVCQAGWLDTHSGKGEKQRNKEVSNHCARTLICYSYESPPLGTTVPSAIGRRSRAVPNVQGT